VLPPERVLFLSLASSSLELALTLRCESVTEKRICERVRPDRLCEAQFRYAFGRGFRRFPGLESGDSPCYLYEKLRDASKRYPERE
jgi:hypothetical protein